MEDITHSHDFSYSFKLPRPVNEELYASDSNSEYRSMNSRSSQASLGGNETESTTVSSSNNTDLELNDTETTSSKSSNDQILSDRGGGGITGKKMKRVDSNPAIDDKGGEGVCHVSSLPCIGNSTNEMEAINALNTIRYGLSEMSRIELNSLAALCYDTRVFLWLKHQSSLNVNQQNPFRDDEEFTEKFRRDFSIQNNRTDFSASTKSNISRPGKAAATSVVNPFSSTADKDKKKQRMYYGLSDHSFDEKISYAEPGAIALHVGCKVQIIKDGREGVVTCEKAGGWREVRFEDGSIARFRPSALRYTGPVSDHPSDNENTYNLSQGSNYSHHSSRVNSSRGIQQPLSRYTSKSSDIMHGHYNKMDNNNVSSLTSFNLQLNSRKVHHFHPNSHFSAYNRDMSSAESSQASPHPNGAGAKNSDLPKTSQQHQDSSQQYMSFSTASPLRNGTRLVVLRTGVEGIVVSEKLGGWRTLQFANGSTASYRPSDLALVNTLEPSGGGASSAQANYSCSLHNESVSDKVSTLSGSGMTDETSSNTSSNNFDDNNKSTAETEAAIPKEL